MRCLDPQLCLIRLQVYDDVRPLLRHSRPGVGIQGRVRHGTYVS